MITDTTFISTQHFGHISGSTSKIFRRSRAQLALRARLKSESPSAGSTPRSPPTDEEVFAYRFREAKLGTLVGRTTPGSVLGAVFRSLSDGSVLMIGGKDVRVGRGVTLEGRCVAPDVLVEEHFPDYANGFDPIYETGLEVVLEKCRARERRSSRGRAVLFL